MPDVRHQAELVFVKMYNFGAFKFFHCLDVLKKAECWKDYINDPKPQEQPSTIIEMKEDVNPIGRDKAKQKMKNDAQESREESVRNLLLHDFVEAQNVRNDIYERQQKLQEEKAKLDELKFLIKYGNSSTRQRALKLVNRMGRKEKPNTEDRLLSSDEDDLSLPDVGIRRY